MLKFDSVVIGSGAAGVGTVAGLISRGLGVCVVDVGRTLEPEIQSRVESLSEIADIERVKSESKKFRNSLAEAKGIPKKLSFTSDYMYGAKNDALIETTESFGGEYSLAFGGLTNTWGSAMLPYRSEDVADWPIVASELDAHYRAMLDIVPLSGRSDDLEGMFPFFTENRTDLKSGPQISAFKDRFQTYRNHLARRGIYCGDSRLAFAPRTEASHGGCIECGLCFYGCPYGIIYSARLTFNRWIDQGRCEYVGGVRVEHFEERSDSVFLSLRNVLTGEVSYISCNRLFIACGILPTAKLVLGSTGSFDRNIVAKDSQAFLLPFLTFRGTRGLRGTPHHTMSQAFIEIIDEVGIASHIQLYPYLDILDDMFSKAIPSSILRSSFVSDNMLSHLLIMQGFLHSNYSSSINISLRKTWGLSVSGNVDKMVRRRLQSVIGKLTRAAQQLGGVPLEPFMRVFLPAASHHWGSTFPMNSSPKELECDPLGHLHGFERVQITDASIFPSIPATTIAFTVMANAHRIASAS